MRDCRCLIVLDTVLRIKYKVLRQKKRESGIKNQDQRKWRMENRKKAIRLNK